ncbi:ATP-binding protein [Candidatus Woesearchaeota archaeon]|nr:ATP-binding protein [Candidatus Woesearchaeota archaeon]
MYKGKSFDAWYIEKGQDVYIQIALHHNKTVVSLKTEDFLKFKDELKGKISGKITSIRSTNKSTELLFKKNNLAIKLPTKKFKTFKKEILNLELNNIRQFIDFEEDNLETFEPFRIVNPQKTFKDLVLPEKTIEELNSALSQVKNHDLIFNKWGLNKQHRVGKAVSLNFIGQPGLGKTLAAEVIAKELNKKLYIVDYSTLIDSYIGETGKNIRYVFYKAAKDNAVLFFDEADSIISSRTFVMDSTDSLLNMDKNILLKELELFEGVVIFSTNLSPNLDKAFERRISAHVLFEQPTLEQREKIYQILLDKKTPLAKDVDFKVLSELYEFTGGDVKRVILNAARHAASSSKKEIAMKDFINAAELIKKSKESLWTMEDPKINKKSVNYIG